MSGHHHHHRSDDSGNQDGYRDEYQRDGSIRVEGPGNAPARDIQYTDRGVDEYSGVDNDGSRQHHHHHSTTATDPSTGARVEEEVQEHHKAKFSHELAAGAAAYELEKQYEKHHNGGSGEKHHIRPIVAALVGAEADKLAETKGRDWSSERRHNRD